MCGIVGVVSSENCQHQVLEGLKKLQYRGYDSAGICLKMGEELVAFKAKGSVEDLEKKCPENMEAALAIGHTRWATHGSVCEKNAHPIFSANKHWAVVHNGIIENFPQLQYDLAKEGVCFKTETDTEVISALLALDNFKDPIQNLIWACGRLKGSYAICAVQQGDQNQILVAKKKSPLYIFSSGSESIVASDPVCFPEGQYYRLEDDEFASVSQTGVIFYNKNGKRIVKETQGAITKQSQVSKGVFKHFMLKEIYETPDGLNALSESFANFDFSKMRKWWIGKVKLIGCGTAYHACLMGARYFKKHLGLDAEAVTASEFRYDKVILDTSTLCIFVSQSGETADTIAAAQKALKHTKKIVALTNVSYSTLSSMTPHVLSICAGPEIAVASTKAYSCQVAALYLLVMALKGEKELKNGLKNVKKTSKLLENFYVNLGRFAEDISACQHVFFIGRGSDYITALEGALKLKEISYINCNAFPAGELKHGVLTLIDHSTPVIVIATEKQTSDKTMNSAFEAKARGGKLYLISSQMPNAASLDKFEMCLTLPQTCPDLECLLATLPLQLLAYNVAVMRGNDPDKPRNLAKSVTVE